LKTKIKLLLLKFSRSRKAIAIPVTFLILFVSMLGLITITYYFAVEKISTRSIALKISTAKQDMITFDQSLTAIIWQPGSARTIDISDSGGKINIQPLSNRLTISVSDGNTIDETIYNQSIGQVFYELPSSDTLDTGLFLRGDSRAIVNQSGSLITQLYIRNGAEHIEIALSYRPTVSYTTAGLEEGKTVNNVRIYIVNMNTSDAISVYGKIPLKASCISTKITTLTYSLPNTAETLSFTSTLGVNSGQVSIPISSTQNGAITNIETVECNIQIQRCVR
jgi:hypothetical protein